MKSIKIWVPILISLSALIYSIINNNKIERLDDKIVGMQNQPIIKLINIKVDDFEFSGSVDPFQLNQNIILPSILKTKLKITLENLGNSTASVIAVLSTDMASGSDLLRKKLQERTINISEKTNQDYFSIKLKPECLKFRDYYSDWQIIPGDTSVFDEEVVFTHKKDGKISLHMLILYTNPAGFLYDSYIWINFEVKNMQVSFNDIDRKNESVAFQFEALNKPEFNYIDCYTTNNFYNKKDSRKIIKFLISLID